MRTVFSAIVVGLVIFSAAVGLALLWDYNQMRDTYMWAEIKGEWHRIGKPTTMNVCLEVLSEVEKIYPNTLMICLSSNVLPYNAKPKVEGIQI